MSQARLGAPRAVGLAAAVLGTGLLVAAPAHAISGGAPAKDGTHQYAAKIELPGRACSGALIEAQWVITAKSCVTGVQTDAGTVTVGRTNLSGNTGQVVKIAGVVPREDRNVALVKLSTPISGVAPVKIGRTAPQNGEGLRIAGYGRTATEWVPNQLNTATFQAKNLGKTTFEVTGASGNASTCKGDAGAPVVRETNGTSELVAIDHASWQNGCLGETQTRQGGTETRVDDLNDWIKQQIPNLSIECKPAVPFYIVRNDGEVREYQHTDPKNGSFNWADNNGRVIGAGWLGARTVAAPNGVMYLAVQNGEFRRYRWNGNGWDTNQAGSQYDVLENGNGWDRYVTPDYRNRITVDTNGDIYTIEPDGKLHWRSYDPARKKLDHRVLSGDWGQYDLIVAAGQGVLYSRKPNGDLFRHVYDAKNGQWTQQAKPNGAGWGMFSSIISVGGDILYGARLVEGGGELLWYRYQVLNGTWADTGRDIGKLVGTGWANEFNITAAPDGCRAV
ncbi:tachylectin-related carbohydrate-binding protein [Streptoalloteichus hindustanus]|uniref:Trypsin n=1 Tax=Streptoalloteichus hindustanus TaxID=2017 RepID=A0A1M4YXX3_STRHI|nr:tachylectin-related carbohydrate-binding protein [Streptoalloteichus hindustanus]SHF10651.1 Trypsin [Streptoalloteichus hindustanus]